MSPSAAATRAAASIGTTASNAALRRRSNHRIHLVFGANTDVGKTVISAGLVRAALSDGATAVDDPAARTVHYVKPLQCGGSDEGFVARYADSNTANRENKSVPYTSMTLFSWETPASPHLSSRRERLPRSDEEVLGTVRETLSSLMGNGSSTTYIETAGGVLSPSSSSPLNDQPHHARDVNAKQKDPLSWGWTTQAELYRPLELPAVLVGDGRLGGISCTLSALESLLLRGYKVHGIVLIDDGGGYENVNALREYASRRFVSESPPGFRTYDPRRSILSLPLLPPEPEPLHDWFESAEVTDTLATLNETLTAHWEYETERLLS